MLRGCAGLGCLGLDPSSDAVRYGVPAAGGVLVAKLFGKKPGYGLLAGLVLAHFDPSGVVSNLTSRVFGAAEVVAQDVTSGVNGLGAVFSRGQRRRSRYPRRVARAMVL